MLKSCGSEGRGVMAKVSAGIHLKLYQPRIQMLASDIRLFLL